MRSPELSQPEGFRGYTMTLCVPISVIRKFVYIGKSSRSLHIRRRRPIKEASAHFFEEWSVEATRRLHSLLLSSLLDTKLFQSVEYPVCKKFMCKTIRMWVGRRHPQLR
jgi:hypothetical protein